PYRSLDTLGMARLILGNHFSSLSLGSLAAVLGLPVKGDTVLKMKGLNTEALCAAGMWDEAAAYCKNDVELCRSIFYRLIGSFPAEQIRMMDLVIRCATQPRLLVDRPTLQAHLEELR